MSKRHYIEHCGYKLNIPTPMGKSDWSIRRIEYGRYRCDDCGMTFNDNSSDIEDHARYHNGLRKIVNEEGIYYNAEDARAALKACEKIFANVKDREVRETTLGYYLLAQYSLHRICCYVNKARTTFTKRQYIKDWIDVNPDKIPKDLIEFASETYCCGQKSYAMQRAIKGVFLTYRSKEPDKAFKDEENKIYTEETEDELDEFSDDYLDTIEFPGESLIKPDNLEVLLAESEIKQKSKAKDTSKNEKAKQNSKRSKIERSNNNESRRKPESMGAGPVGTGAMARAGSMGSTKSGGQSRTTSRATESAS